MKISPSRILLAGFLLLGPWLTGCAISTDKIDLAYSLRGARDKVPGAEAVAVNLQIKDDRAVKDKVGKKMNGYGMEMGAIVSRNDVPGLVQGAILSELDARGFAHGDSVSVTGDLNKFWNHFTIGFFAGDSLAEISLTVTVKDHAGQILFVKTIDEEGKEPNVQVAGGHNAKPALQMALWKAIDDLFADPAFIPAILKAGGATSPPAQK